mgnify:FL=1
MKKILLFVTAVMVLSFVAPEKGISKKERKDAAKFLKETEMGVYAAVKNLSEAQLKFKAAEDKWSAEDCLKHIAASETMLWQAANGAIEQAANPEKRTEIKMTDEEVKTKIADRSHKVKTMTPLEPQNIAFKNAEEALASFKGNRATLITYVSATEADLRNHVAIFPFASLDAYQVILFIGAHSRRHTLQIEEVKMDPNFPKE